MITRKEDFSSVRLCPDRTIFWFLNIRNLYNAGLRPAERGTFISLLRAKKLNHVAKRSFATKHRSLKRRDGLRPLIK
ncbi:MAG: hypothetical protein FWG44_04000 [Oscillospiraceae bacterium]|nr:hypothetical protein [Oscillospiraceae bacterium]